MPKVATTGILAVSQAEVHMPIRIEDREVDGLVRELSRLTGESPAATIAQALRERLVRERARAELARHLQAIAARGRADLRPGPAATDDSEFYDEAGLPR